MTLEYFPHIGFIVFRTQRDHDSAVIEIEYFLLEFVVRGTGIGFPKFDCCKALLSDDSAPQRVVTIQDQALPLFAFQRTHVLENLDRYLTQRLARIWSLADMPIAQIVK